MNYKIVVGDWSGDGHNKTEDFIVSVNKTKKEILEAYKRTEKDTRVSLTDKLFAEYEDNFMSIEVANSLKKYGVDFNEVDMHIEYCDNDDEYDLPEGYNFTPEGAVVLFMEMAKVNLPDMKYKLLEFEELTKGIGYGFFK